MLPNLIVVGAQKCATSSLHQYLDAHPDICMSETKELDFFVAEKQWRRGLDWYRSQFPSDAPLRGESSPNYTAFPLFKGVPERMHSLIPEAKLIYVVRDPVDRMLSENVHARQTGRTKLGVREALLDPEAPFYHRSRYWTQISQYLQHYDKSQILVVDYDELAVRPRECMREIYRFLGVNEAFDSDVFSRRFHRSQGKREFTATGRALQAAYRAVKRLLPATTSGRQLAGGWRQAAAVVPDRKTDARCRGPLGDRGPLRRRGCPAERLHRPAVRGLVALAARRPGKPHGRPVLPVAPAAQNGEAAAGELAQQQRLALQ